MIDSQRTGALAIFVFHAMSIEDSYKIGYIQRTHGLKGEVTVVFTPDAPATWEELTTVFVEHEGQLVPYFIQSLSRKGDKAFAKWDEVDTLEQAKALQGCAIYLPKSLRPKSGRNEFHNDEVTGFLVVDKAQGELGGVTGVEQHGAQRFLAFSYHQKEHLLPLNAPFLKSVNKTTRRITVELPAGFLDI
ncbi:MAG: ribosome maturation factor RimM [Cyclobacteriaceae bacterium]|jgi:16S rRNA processing protein RimM|nr:ribosome maturation factor RimM [Cyclobacteriaceae bacterium]